MSEEKILYKDLSYKIVGLAMEVHNELGPGFLEKVYENALLVMFEENGISARSQVPIQVHFRGRVVGDYFADIVVEDSIIIELKAQDRIAEIHKAQALNYLKATRFKLALLINFGKYRLEYERLVL
ncbi:MAG TPA: GxxExxY protein [Pyrinomonadaceae bacterium]|nr:GxxExxY protein [Pyrinomonadaceae bacterium]